MLNPASEGFGLRSPGGSRCPHRDFLIEVSRRDGAIHLAKSRDPLRVVTQSAEKLNPVVYPR
jgi:hypothetical protein